jgi:hypothetical protein
MGCNMQQVKKNSRLMSFSCSGERRREEELMMM